MRSSGQVSSGLTDRSVDSWPWMESPSGYRQGQKDSSKVPLLEKLPGAHHPHGDESFTGTSQPYSHPERQWEPPRLFPSGVRVCVEPWQTTTKFVPCFVLCFSLGSSTFCIEVCTKPNSSSVKWKSSRLFERCTVLFVRAADSGEGAQDIMPVPLGKHIRQWSVCEKGNRLTRTRVSPNCFS